MIKEVVGDILSGPSFEIVIHQCNCVTSGAGGLAAQIFRRYPTANTYADVSRCALPTARTLRLEGILDLTAGGYVPDAAAGVWAPMVAAGFVRIPGTISLHVAPADGRRIVNLYAQNRSGGPDVDGGEEMRLAWFRQGLERLPGGDDIVYAFPKLIGCGLAGGTWSRYKAEIDRFAAAGRQVTIYDYAPS